LRLRLILKNCDGDLPRRREERERRQMLNAE
jgi:hypothetical protein